MSRTLATALAIFSLFSLFFCLTLPASAQESDRLTIYVISHGWHTGVVIPTDSLSADDFPVLRDFAGFDFLECGWGDEGFYRAEAITLPIALRAVSMPTATVMHVVGLDGLPEREFPDSEIIEVELQPQEFAALISFIAKTFADSEDKKLTNLGPGIYGSSQFYRAIGSYYFPNTCNVWTLKALKAAGREVIPIFGIRADNVLHQVAPFGRVIRIDPPASKWPLGISVAAALSLAAAIGRKTRRLGMIGWALIGLATTGMAASTIMAANQNALPDWCATVGMVALCMGFTWAAVDAASKLKEKFRKRSALALTICVGALVVFASPL